MPAAFARKQHSRLRVGGTRKAAGDSPACETHGCERATGRKARFDRKGPWIGWSNTHATIPPAGRIIVSQGANSRCGPLFTLGFSSRLSGGGFIRNRIRPAIADQRLARVREEAVRQKI